MNDPEKISIDIDEQRKWLNDHRAERPDRSWKLLAKKIGVPMGTLSSFGGGTYPSEPGNRSTAEAIYRYRQLLTAQATVEVLAPEVPGFFPTPTARRILTTLSYAQRGRIVMITGAPGTQKTMTMRHYQASVGNVFIATMAPSTAGVNTMQIAVLEALGEPNAKGTPQALSRRIKAKLSGSGALLVFDEAQFLSEKATEEIRSWHDAIGIGIALVGNRDVLIRIEHGSRVEAYARLASRLGPRLLIDRASDADIDALLDAWRITDTASRKFTLSIGAKPGGMRNCTMMLETASMLAAGLGEDLSVGHLEDAWNEAQPHREHGGMSAIGKVVTALTARPLGEAVLTLVAFGIASSSVVLLMAVLESAR